MNGLEPTVVVGEKALRLLDEHRVVVRGDSAFVAGETAYYRVEATPASVECSCPAGQNPDPVSCSHKVAAQVLWREALRDA